MPGLLKISNKKPQKHYASKAHDHLIEASKLEVVADDPLGEKRSAAEIAKAYADVQLPDD